MAHIDTPIPQLKLNDGKSIPMLAYGTGTAWSKKGDESQVDRDLIDAIKLALSLEYYHLDCADMYKTEGEVGTAIKESGVDRSKLYITTKCLPSDAFRPGDIPRALDQSLKKLKVDYVDLYLIHSPFNFKSDGELQQAWAEMEEVQKSGKAKSIGVSNFLSQHFRVIEKTQSVIPAINQTEFHAYLQRPELLDYTKKRGIATAAYGPLTAVIKAHPGPVDDFMAALAKKYAVSEAEVALRWCIDQDIVAVTTSSKEQRLSDMLRTTKFKLTPAEVKRIGELGEQKHFRGFWTAKFDPNDRS